MQPPITLADRRNVPEAESPAGRLAFKNAERLDSPAGQMLAVDEAEGIVTAIVSVTGTEDEVADVIEPGAYRATLTKRRPKVCWAHSWERPIGRVLHIEELLPGDDRLPTKTRDGKAWPVEAGALVATMQFNMKSDAGKEAFEAVRFYSETGECEYSIGYQVPMGKSSRNPKTGVRHIKALELYELSVVLFGAHTMTGTLSIKAAYAAALERKSLRPRGQSMDAVHGLTGTVAISNTPRLTAKAALAAARKSLLGDGDKPEVPDHSDGVMVAVYPDAGAADKVAAHIAGPDATTDRSDLHVTLAFLGNTDEVSMSSEEIVRAVTGAVEGIPVLEGTIGGIGQFPDTGDGAPTWAPVDVAGLGLLREQVVAALGDAVRTDHGFTPHMTLGYDIGLIDPVPATDVTFSNVRVVYGQTQSEISLGAGGLPVEDPSGKSIEEVVRLTAIANLAAQTKAGGADRNRGQAEELRKYWVHGEGAAKIAWGTSGDFTRCVKFLSEHMDPERAKGYCANRHKEATGMWPGDKNNKSIYDPDLDAKSSPVAVSGSFPHLPGTYEARMSVIREAVVEALRGEPTDDDGDRYEWDHVAIDATWDDRLIATRHNWSAAHDASESYEMTYSLGEDGVTLGDPAPVALEVVAVYPDGQEADGLPIADALPLADDIGRIVYALKSTRPSTIEGKAGRVLSGRNERRLREAVHGLLDVLSAAGVDISPDDEREPLEQPGLIDTTSDPRREVDPTVDVTSTAPSASTGRKVLTMADIDADLAALGLA